MDWTIVKDRLSETQVSGFGSAMEKYIVAGTSQVETSKLLITSDEKKSQVAEGHA